jgi:hypothetical protein
MMRKGSEEERGGRKEGRERERNKKQRTIKE